MKKLSKLAIAMFILIIMIIAMETKGVLATTDTGTTTNAEETEKPKELKWADTSKMKITTVTPEASNQTFNVSIKIEGILTIEEHDYYLYVTKSKISESDVKMNEYGTVIAPECDTRWMGNNKEAKTALANKYFELNGDTYVYIYETQYDETTKKQVGKFIVTAHKVDRLSYKLGSRMKGYFHGQTATAGGYTSITLWTAHDYNINRNVKLKIGRVTDNSILRAIQKGESGSLTKLLNYAKSAQSVYTTTVPLGDSAEITSKFSISDGAYYYVYMELDDGNGKYYPVEDVSLYQGANDSTGKFLFDYLSDDFKWNLDEETPQTKPETKPEVKPQPEKKENKQDNTVMPGKKIPQLGQSLVIIIIAGTALIIGIIFAIKSKKYKIR